MLGAVPLPDLERSRCPSQGGRFSLLKVPIVDIGRVEGVPIRARDLQAV